MTSAFVREIDTDVRLYLGADGELAYYGDRDRAWLSAEEPVDLRLFA